MDHATLAEAQRPGPTSGMVSGLLKIGTDGCVLPGSLHLGRSRVLGFLAALGRAGAVTGR